MKVFWDTNLFIYLWEGRSHAKEMASLAAFFENGEHTLATSTLTLGEILVQPARNGDEEIFKQYCEAMSQLVTIPFDAEAALCFARLRAENPSLRPPDAIQLACALSGRCDEFLTNDNRLSGLKIPGGLVIRSLTDWPAGSSS